MFITNNRASFHLSLKENLIKRQKVSKYNENGCLQNLFLIFMSLLAAPIVKSSHIQTRTYYIFLKNNPKTNLEVFQY